MTIDLVFPKLPPALDGIGDHTALLASALARRGERVRILTGQPDADPVPGVEVARVIGAGRPTRFLEVEKAVLARRPEALIIQFNQFSYGRWGLNPFLPLLVWRLRRALPRLRVATMFHENYMPVTNWRNALMTTWQRAQFWALGRMADVAAFSVEPWADQYRSWFPRADVVHWPVGSNIPDAGIGRDEARSRLGIPTGAFVAGVFGTLNAARPLEYVRAALQTLHEHTETLVILYIGPSGAAFSEGLSGLPVRDAGTLPGLDVSVHLRAMDLHLAPFIDGASTRRGTLLAGLQHGVPSLSTQGPLTDPLMLEHDGGAFRLVPMPGPTAFAQAALALASDERLRQHMGAAAVRFFEAHFTWETVAERVLTSLQAEEVLT